MHSSYDNTLSSSFTEVGYEVEVSFGTGSISGFMSCDDFSIGDAKVRGQHFGEITSEEGKKGCIYRFSL